MTESKNQDINVASKRHPCWGRGNAFQSVFSAPAGSVPSLHHSCKINMPSPVKEGIMITVLPNNSVSGNQTLTSQETKEATAIIDFISEGFESIGIGIGHADLQVIKYPGRGYPQFCSKLLNAELSADLIYLDMDSFAYPKMEQGYICV